MNTLNKNGKFSFLFASTVAVFCLLMAQPSFGQGPA
jgi:hypothetical protein